jgi:hypothetical protein
MNTSFCESRIGLNLHEFIINGPKMSRNIEKVYTLQGSKMIIWL